MKSSTTLYELPRVIWTRLGLVGYLLCFMVTSVTLAGQRVPGNCCSGLIPYFNQKKNQAINDATQKPQIVLPAQALVSPASDSRPPLDQTPKIPEAPLHAVTESTYIGQLQQTIKQLICRLNQIKPHEARTLQERNQIIATILDNNRKALLRHDKDLFNVKKFGGELKEAPPEPLANQLTPQQIQELFKTQWAYPEIALPQSKK